MVPAAVVAFVGTSATTEVPDAEAWCRSPGDGRPLELWYYSLNLGTENINSSGTCDGDGYYAGKVIDPYADGSCVFTRITEDGGWSSWVQGVSCTNTWAGYQYWDSDNLFQLRVETTFAASPWHYNWGH